MVSATVRRAAVQMGAGLLLGSGIGFGLLSLASILPWRLGAGHSLFIALVPAVLALSILFALWRPLSRALAIRPADALRYE
jgi:ABC-type antimicrobial peptide transport system permease subunit